MVKLSDASESDPIDATRYAASLERRRRIIDIAVSPRRDRRDTDANVNDDDDRTTTRRRARNRRDLESAPAKRLALESDRDDRNDTANASATGPLQPRRSLRSPRSAPHHQDLGSGSEHARTRKRFDEFGTRFGSNRVRRRSHTHNEGVMTLR